MVLILAFHHPLLVGFARLFRVDNPAPSDAIVMLLGGLSNRPERAAELYRQGIAPRILICTSAPDLESSYNETRLSIHELTKRGVPREAIEILPNVTKSTRDEATSVATFRRSHPLHRITVVTTAFHTTRARWIFRKVLADPDLDIRMAASENPDFPESEWYRTDEGLLAYLNELFKIVYYRLRY